jgi:hypothetical protein
LWLATLLVPNIRKYYEMAIADARIEIRGNEHFIKAVEDASTAIGTMKRGSPLLLLYEKMHACYLVGDEKATIPFGCQCFCPSTVRKRRKNTFF